MGLPLRSALLLAAALFPVGEEAVAQEVGLQAAVRLAGEGRLAEALGAARGEPRALERAQAELHVLHHSGQLTEALEAGLAGLQAAPGDPWLLERCAYVALSLGTGELALRLCEELREVDAPAAWEGHAWMLEEAEGLVAQRERESTALSRARWTVVLALLIGLGTALAARRRLPADG